MPHGFAVEEPITNYFRRVSSTRNHKQNLQVTRSTTKRKRLQTSQAEDADESQKRKARQKLTCTDYSRNKSCTSQAKTGFANKDLPVNLEQATDDGVEDGHEQCGSLRVPPPSTQPNGKYSRLVRPIYLPTAVSSRSSPHSSAVASPPTPDTVACRIASAESAREVVEADVQALLNRNNPADLHSAQPHSQNSTGGGNRVYDGIREQDHVQERSGDNDPFAGTAGSQMPILSSQTQEVDLYPLDILPLQALTDTSSISTVFRFPHLPERNFSYRIPLAGDSDSDGFIHSSQSQHILPHHMSPRRKCADNRPLDSINSLVDESTFEEVIPSSQSQTERELHMSRRILDYHSSGKVVIRGSQSESPPHQNELPPVVPQGCSRRRLSDELPPVPPPDMTLSEDGFDLTSMDPVYSETEDESGDEFKLSTRIPSGLSLDVMLGSDSEILQETAEFNSLPNTVQDFEVMFGESSGGFPMSLQ